MSRPVGGHIKPGILLLCFTSSKLLQVLAVSDFYKAMNDIKDTHAFFPGGSTTSAVLNNICYTMFEHFGLMAHFGFKLIFLLSLIFFVVASSFRSHFGTCSSSDSGDHEVEGICVQLANLSNLGRKSLGFSIPTVVLLFLPYYAFRVQDVFVGSLAYQIQYCYYVGNLVAFLALSAEAHAQVRNS